MTDIPIAALPFPRGFASDNFAAAHPRVLEAVASINRGHAMAYGDDEVTDRARKAFDRLFGKKVATHFVFNGTGANVTALMAFARPFGAVLCSETAHVVNDESTAPERFLGMRMLTLPSVNGKIDPAGLEEAVTKGHGVHGAAPVVLTLTQPTEVGTLYTLEELRTLVRIAHSHGLKVHMDGARLGCAAAALGARAREIVVETDIDVVSFGGTKQGMLFGEAVVFLDPEAGSDYPFLQKVGMQLASKNRFIAAQFLALLEDDLWISNGRRAIEAARRLRDEVSGIPWVEVVFPVEANSVFARIPPELIEPLQAEQFFWPWDERKGLVRWMCAFDTTPEDVARYGEILRSVKR